MKFKLFVLIIFYSISSFSQCFDCGHSLGGHVEDYVVDIDKVSDGIVLTFNPQQGWGRSIYKYDFNCNLIWANEFQPNLGITDNMGFYNTTVDENDNIYSVIGNNRNGVVVDGFGIERGNSLIKLNSSGNIQWVRKISDDTYLPRQVHVWNNDVFVVGQLDEAINTNIGLTVANGSRSQYFIAKFDTYGNLIDAQQYGAESNEILHDSQIDENGYIYFTGLVSNTSHVTYLNKVNSNLELLWAREMSSNSTHGFTPMTLYYNNSNGKLYVWTKYYLNANFYNNSVTVSSGCDVGSIIMEVSKNTGDLENYKVIDNCGFLSSVSNGIGHVVQKSFMTHEGSNLYILSSFRGEITIGNQTISTTQAMHGEYNSDLILHKIDLTNFSSELILKSSGESYYTSSPYYDLAGPIVAFNNSIYITSSFMSYPLIINGNTIINNSGNGARDVLYYKHNLNQHNSNSLISFENTCFSETTKFLINGDFDSVLWNFDDPSSGSDNTSTLIDPGHIFTNPGTYDVSAIVTCGTETETINLEIRIYDSPTINQIPDLFSCEDTFGSQISSSFDTASIESDLMGNQSNLSIQYFDDNGNELPSPLPNPMRNTVLGQETITARIAYIDNPQCFRETTFDLIVNPIPYTESIEDLIVCDNESNGFALFNLQQVKENIIANNTNIDVEFYHENGNRINEPLNTVENLVINEEVISVRAINTNCYNETTFKLKISPLPSVNISNRLIGCDENNDGISEYFDTSNVESMVIGNQSGLEISYYDSNGNLLQVPLPNPYTNSVPYQETLTVRVTNITTGCYAETSLELITSEKPEINQPEQLFTCDEGNGYGVFDISSIEEQLIGNQSGLIISYFDLNGNILPSSLLHAFKNTEAWHQTIFIKVENAFSNSCVSETTIDLVVQELPGIDLDQAYFLCDLKPFLSISVGPYSDTYEWRYEDGTVISNTFEAELIESGNYSLTVGKSDNGIFCENIFDFEMLRSLVPSITDVRYQDLSDNNYIEIIASGGNELEYSIDGVIYQDNNIFYQVPGGTYNISVRDKKGCGDDSQEIFFLNYPKFFTPNNDMVNDYWQINGIENFPSASIRIFDRYGKVLKKLNPNSQGWDGTLNGAALPSTDYWFTVDLRNGKSFKGHFSLKR